VAIFSETRMEWTLADLGGIVAGAQVVPIYQTASAEEANHVLEDSESRLVFCEDEEKLELAKEASEDLSVEYYVLFEGDADDAISLGELRERGGDNSAVDERVEDLSEDDVFTLIYTSGTTGPPKGCVLTHANYRANCKMVESTIELGEDDAVFVFLPLAHALSRMAQMVALDTGTTIAYWEGDKNKAMDNLKEVAPTFFPAVPRIFEKIYEEARKSADGRVKEKLFEKAVDVGREVRELERKGEEPGPVLRKEHDLADKQVLSKVRELFGGNLRFALTGAAPVAKEMLEFFDACGVLVLEGYGATETSAIATANTPDEWRFGTVGKAFSPSRAARRRSSSPRAARTSLRPKSRRRSPTPPESPRPWCTETTAPTWWPWWRSRTTAPTVTRSRRRSTTPTPTWRRSSRSRSSRSSTAR
jgi:long-chain acyl-CoA synthetase